MSVKNPPIVKLSGTKKICAENWKPFQQHNEKYALFFKGKLNFVQHDFSSEKRQQGVFYVLWDAALSRLFVERGDRDDVRRVKLSRDLESRLIVDSVELSRRVPHCSQVLEGGGCV
jgi:hypothetical protein